MKKPILKTVLLLTMLGSVSVSQANGFGNFFGGNNNGFGNFFGGNNNGDNNWPVWTPMYWMEEMSDSFGNNNNNNRNSGYYGGGYPNVSAYQPSPYGSSPYAMANPYATAPYATAPYPPRQQQAYIYRPAPTVRNYSTAPQNSYRRSSFPSFGGNNMSGGFPSFGGGNNNPFSSFSSPFGSSFSSPMNMGSGGFPSMNSINPMGGMGGFGSPMSMGSMGMPGMSPMSSFGGSPFGGSSFVPFR